MPPKLASAAPDLSVIGAPSSPVRTGSQSGASSSKKKKTHRGPGKKRKNRRQSFAAPSEGGDSPSPAAERPGLEDVPEVPHEQSFYRLGNRATNSNGSLESEALLDHRYDSTSNGRRFNADMIDLVDRKHTTELVDKVSRINLADLGRYTVNQHRVDRPGLHLVHQPKLVVNS